ncbi:hypothetical protein [Pinibacter soli]|uniref:Uncharacterized protein n=1 Tax=Pinibacter soli TaxID=3044211 RepID=A0ABT6RIF2_9BACT|nr:hypothetical protein [Pinibacter soli]MDI3321617.1 hypothetical protein [Pinibacter soli]
MKSTLILIACLVVVSCNNNGSKSPVTEGHADSLTQERIEKHTEDAATSPAKSPENGAVQTDSVLNLELPQNGDSLTVRILKISAPVTCNFQVRNKCVLFGRIITPGDKGNIRFNQIFMPDKSSDGPFGKELNYDIKKTGLYKLLIGEDLMAEKPYRGEFTLELKISQK